MSAVSREPDAGPLDEPSRLPGWSRRTVLAHLHAGALASARMTREALIGEASEFYPDGSAERAATLRAFDGLEPATVYAQFATSAQELAALWGSLSPAEWTRPFTESRFGEISLSRLLMLRLTELTVHGEDIDLGLQGWNREFVTLALPLRLAWLPSHHRPRPDADLSVRGRWLLGDGARWWLLQADSDGASVAAASSEEQTDVVLRGSPEELLRVLLGRLPASALVVDGDAAFAELLKAAFPGP